MWLFLVGLAILTGDVLSQVNKVIDSETDMLALPSDQLIHSSAELLAVEDMSSGLPFGTRIPGYETPLFAYSYTVGENSSGPDVNSYPKIIHHFGIESADSAISLPKPTFRDSSTIESHMGITRGHLGQHDRHQSTYDRLSHEPVNSTISHQRDSKLGTVEVFSKENSSLFDHLPLLADEPLAPNPKAESHSELNSKMKKKGISDLNSDYLPPLEEFTPHLHLPLNHLPPKNAAISFPTTQTDTTTTNKQPPPLLELELVPPNKHGSESIAVKYGTTKPNLVQQYQPPNEVEKKDFSFINENLPPKTGETKTINLSKEYLPPKSEETKRIHLNQEYLPPKSEETKPFELNQEYLPPKSEETKPIELNQEYLPPKSEETKAINLNQEYLPPKGAETKPIDLNQEYLPPKSEETKTINFSQEYLPPQEKKITKISVIQDYLPPVKEEWKAIDSNQTYRPISASGTLQESSSHEIDKSISETRLVSAILPFDEEPLGVKSVLPVSAIVPFAIERTLAPPTIEKLPSPGKFNLPFIKSQMLPNSFFPIKQLEVLNQQLVFDPMNNNSRVFSVTTDPINEPILPISYENHQPHSSVISSISSNHIENENLHKLRPIVQNLVFSTHKEAKVELNPHGTEATSEHGNKPVVFSTLQKGLSPFSVVSEHKIPSIKPIARGTKSTPFVTFSVRGQEEGKANKRDKIIKAEAFPSKIINDPIIPISVHTKRFDTPSIEEKKQKVSVQALGVVLGAPNTTPQLKPIREKQDLKVTAVDSTQSRHSYTKHHRHSTPIADLSNQIRQEPIISQQNYAKIPLALFHETNSRIQPVRGTSNAIGILLDATTTVDCLSHGECQETEVCHQEKCVAGCSLTHEICVGRAVCETRHHIPGCVCPSNFIARNFLSVFGSIRFDCTTSRVMMPASSSNIIKGAGERSPSHYNKLSYQRPIVGVPLAADDDYTPQRFVHSPIRANPSRTNPCSDDPCGPNTRCSVNRNGIALCRCIEDYVPDGNTINGCKPQCSSDSDCPDDYKCSGQKCGRVCGQGACGLLAECKGRNHVAVCSCPSGYGGDPHSICRVIKPEIREPEHLEVDPCQPSPCGTNADCRARGEQPVCSCPAGYEGNPLTHCQRGECIRHEDCPNHRACQALRCIDPCSTNVCGTGSDCTVRNHQPVCSCPQNHIGDPLTSCRRITEYDICNPSPCGQNTNCRAKTDRASGSLRAVCSCIENYIGNPLTGCHAECHTSSECPDNKECRDNRCRNPCIDGCGEGALCDVRNHRAVCSCPEYFQGDPYNRCYPECVSHDTCPSYQACLNFKCGDPCEGSCGRGANCVVEDHTPICSCPRDHTGDPFDFCRPFTPEDLCTGDPCGSNAICTPGKDRSGNDRPVCLCQEGYVGNPLISCQLGDCKSHNDCRDTEACYAYQCQSPCHTQVGPVCGENAHCNVKDHQPVCSCPKGYTGNPLEHCRISPGARIAGRSYRKV